MIKDFPELPLIVPPNAQIPTTYIKKFRRAYESGDYQYCAELACALMYLFTTGRLISDDERIVDLLELNEDGARAKVDSYVDRVKESREMEAHAQQLDLIADYLRQGFTQKQIADKIGVTQSTISKRIKKIKTAFPELLDI